MIRNTLEYIGKNFLAARNEAFTSHPVAEFLRREAPRAIAEALGNPNYIVDGSPGQGQWAEIPWIATVERRSFFPCYDGER
jgi:hypothetical protein